jgi:hypothetical protein
MVAMTIVLAVALLVAFFSAKGLLRQGAEARSLEAGVMDRGTTAGWARRSAGLCSHSSDRRS